MDNQGKQGILLVNTGTPAAPTPRAVRRYLSQFLMDDHIVPMNKTAWWLILHLCILPSRGRASAKKYRSIWTPEGSPFMVAHEKLQRGLQAAYDQDGRDVEVLHAMSYGQPSLPDQVRRLREAGCQRVTVLPLYPQSARSTTLSVKDAVQRAFQACGQGMSYQVIDNYHDSDFYIRALCASLEHAGFGQRGHDRILFSYHSIPLADIEAGDTYELQTGATSLAVASQLGIERTQWTIGYQCRFDKSREWLAPFTKDVLERTAEGGEGRLFVICPGFAVDCLETLYDVGQEMEPFYQRQLQQHGRILAGREFAYVPCLGASKAHAKVLYQVLEPYVRGDIDG